jgi:hypothetical protein
VNIFDPQLYFDFSIRGAPHPASITGPPPGNLQMQADSKVANRESGQHNHHLQS